MDTIDLSTIGDGRLRMHEDWTARQCEGEILRVTRTRIDPHAAFWASVEAKTKPSRVIRMAERR
jgi:hypothetical protein